MKILKRLFCKHKFKTETNLYGDAINWFDGARSIRRCVLCGKKAYGALDPNCKSVNIFYGGHPCQQKNRLR